MPRPQRIEFAGAWYHVLNASHDAIFTRPANILRFLEVVQDTIATYGIGVHAWYVGKNRYDLLISTPLANISTAMRHLNSVFTQDLNRLQNNSGGLFKGRYKAVLLDPTQYAWPVSRYIHCLPTQNKRYKSASEYKWSSMECYSARSCDTGFVDTRTLFELRSPDASRRDYVRYVEQGVDSSTEQFYSRKNLRSLRVGPEFLKRQRRVNGAPSPIALRKIAQITAQHFTVKPDSLFSSRRGPQGGNIPRAVSMLIGREVGHYTLKEIADYYHIDDVSTVSVTIKRLKNKCQEQPSLSKQIELLRSHVNAADKNAITTTSRKKKKPAK